MIESQESMSGRRCATPNCTDQHGPLTLRAKCHPQAGLGLVYSEPVLVARCLECNAVAGVFALAKDAHFCGEHAAQVQQAIADTGRQK